jgi:hypothetical protein
MERTTTEKICDMLVPAVDHPPDRSYHINFFSLNHNIQTTGAAYGIEFTITSALVMSVFFLLVRFNILNFISNVSFLSHSQIQHFKHYYFVTLK